MSDVFLELYRPSKKIEKIQKFENAGNFFYNLNFSRFCRSRFERGVQFFYSLKASTTYQMYIYFCNFTTLEKFYQFKNSKIQKCRKFFNQFDFRKLRQSKFEKKVKFFFIFQGINKMSVVYLFL